MTPVALAEMPRWPKPVGALVLLDGGAIFLLVTAWLRATYPPRLERWRSMWKPRYWKDCDSQRYVDLPPRIDVAAFRRALQGVE